MVLKFGQWLLEGKAEFSWTEACALIKTGLSTRGFRLVKATPYWENIGEKTPITGEPLFHLKYEYFQNWPFKSEEDYQQYLTPSAELTRLYLNNLPGDVELMTDEIYELAEDHDAEVLWITLDNQWLDGQTFEPIQDLRQLL